MLQPLSALAIRTTVSTFQLYLLASARTASQPVADAVGTATDDVATSLLISVCKGACFSFASPLIFACLTSSAVALSWLAILATSNCRRVLTIVQSLVPQLVHCICWQILYQQ